MIIKLILLAILLILCMIFFTLLTVAFIITVASKVNR